METSPKLFQVSIRTVLEVTAIVAFILALMYLRAENKNGRFQTTAAAMSNGPVIVYVTDTVTGQVWMSDGGKWIRYSPLPAAP